MIFIEEIEEQIEKEKPQKEKPTDRIVQIRCINEFGEYPLHAVYVKPLDIWLSTEGEVIKDKVLSWDNIKGRTINEKRI